NAEARSVLFERCREYLLPELEILCPQVIVTQSRQAARSLSKVLGTEEQWGSSCRYQSAIICERPVLWIITYHPSARKRYWDEKHACWPEFARVVRSFVNDESKAPSDS